MEIGQRSELPPLPELDRAQARELVDEIAVNHGYLPPHVVDLIPDEIRATVLHALQKKDNMIAASVSTLAQILYSSSAHFIFELLQNAADNNYFKALAEGHDPEKSIGFKSTFMAAWKVQIESGPFTFYFEHQVGDSGMGMITPIWFEPENEFQGPGTRISLYFHDNGTPDDLTERRDEVITQLKELQGEALFPNFPQGSELRTSKFDATSGIDSEMVRQFHVTKYDATGLSRNENRSYSETEEGLALYSTSRVVLAFTLDENDEPITEIQDVFAFMPVRKIGFNFLIHADFVTQANRQDIVWSSQRNVGLRKAIGQALVKGIEELAKHQTLQYKWMRYLPREESLNHSPFWKDMVSEIKSPLSQAQVLVPIRQAARCPIQQMRQLEPRYLDKNGDPLIPDLCNSPMYLSKDYEDNDLNILREYGLSVLQVYEIYPILSAMVQEQSWKEAIFETRDEDWHSRLAKLILAAINYDMTQLSGSSQPSGNIGPPSSSSGLFSFGSRETADAQIRGNSNTGPSNISLFAFSSQGKTTASATDDMKLFDHKNREDAFLPFPALLSRCGSFLKNHEAVNFLKAEAPLEDDDPCWMGFAKHFGIKVNDGIHLSVEILRALITDASAPADSMWHSIWTLYNRIYAQYLSFDQKDKHPIKALFRTYKSFIYIGENKDGVNKWFKTSECLWSANGAIVRKPSLDEIYPDLKEFFHKFLEIPELDLRLFYKELVDMHDTVPTTAAAKDMLISLNAMLSSSSDPVRFGPQAERFHIFPAILPNGTRKVLRSHVHFFINDRRHYAEALKDSLTILDLTLDEVTRLHGVFEWFDLKDRYLSQAVVEKARVKEGNYEKLNSLTRDLALKAPALVSIAIYSNESLDPDKLNASLQKVQVYVTDSIKSTLIAEEGGKKVEKFIGKSDLHIQRLDNGDLRIYLTTDEDSRDLAIASKLPRELMAALLGYDTRKVDATVFNIVASILQAKRSHVHQILELNGVPDLNLPCLVGENYLAAEVEAENRKMAILPNSPGRSSQSSLTLQDTYDKDAYLDVLVHVVEAARAHQFPTKSGESDLSQALNGLNISNSKPKPKQLKFSHSNTDEWKQMVGAAGELFVFEILSNLDPSLPKFGRSNWQSVIRRFVTDHPDYADMDAWVGEEDGDIQYKDTQNALTDYLIEKGYFDETWIGECPEYHIEVKTSVGNLGAPFHMSKSQYNRMRRYWSEANTRSSRKKVFAIFRVYGIESGDIGLKVYVDAESESQGGNLKFEADSWVVRAL
ncbi:unnamed protein product [Clonostachys chloroleuca]|uniref:Protein NO VEIN C-terminal domain-containing protein n=1 Tax=Clonostachys chloroleuca TaxID=1926264 RepID=A0AA35MF37_9HYPO|nr:unnamed protein product [Clonostachys chloroleuca]